MAEEKRRLIYELLVEARGAKDLSKELGEAKSAFAGFESVAKKGLAVLAAGFTIKGIADTLDEVTRFNAQIAVLGVSGNEATKALQAVQNIAFTTGQTMQGVGEAFKNAVELQQQLGGSTEAAARTAQAFVRAAVAEGRSAQQAAADVETLAFAFDKGSIKAKEFIRLIRENETFQQAAQQALSATTGQLVAMAEAGELTNVALVKVLHQFEDLAEHREVAVTFDSVVESLKTLAKTFVEGIAAGAGWNSMIGESSVTSLRLFSDNVRGIALEIGGLVRLVSNFAQQMVNVAALFANVLTDPLAIVDHWDQYTRRVTTDLEDMKAAMDDIQRGFVMGTNADPNYSAAGQAEAQARTAAERAAALEQARWRDFSKGMTGAFDESVKKWKDMQKEVAKAREEQAERDKREAEKRAKELQQQQIREAEEAGRIRLEEAQKERDLQEWLESERVRIGEEATEQLGRDAEQASEDFAKMMEEQMRMTRAVQSELYYAFSDLFSGGIHNAREFFRTVLQGLAQVFAQQAAMKAAAGSEGFLNWIFGSASGSLGGVGGSAQPSAKGNVFAGGERMAFARGGIVSAPTIFPMARGGVGLMGEAGPEAIMPLRRMRDGSLGVRSGTPEVTVINQTGVAATARVSGRDGRLDIVLEAAQLGAAIAEQRVNRSMRSGYGPTAQSMQRTYGLRRAF